MRRVRRQFMAVVVLGFAAAAIPHGQGQTQPPGAASQSTTIVGCLVRGPSTSTEEFFVRTPAMSVPAGATIAVGGSGAPTGGSAPTSAGTPAGTTAYRITGLSAAELKPHVGHRIEVQGRLSQNTPPTPTATTTQDPKTGRATTSVKEDWTIAGVLNATTMKMVAATCQ